MGSYISVLCMNYNKHIFNENQYASLFTFSTERCVYIWSLQINDEIPDR